MAETMNNRYRETCIELVLQGYSRNRVAAELGISLSTVRYHTKHLVVPKPTITRPYKRKSSNGTDNLQPPEPLSPSASLAYLIGVISGDGSLSWHKSGTCQLSIACDTRYPALMECYSALIEELLGTKPYTYIRKRGTWANIGIYGKHIPVLIGLPCGKKKTNGYKVPEWIFTELAYLRRFVQGLIETDGGIYRTHHHGGTYQYCCFTARNVVIMDAFLKATSLLGFTFTLKGYEARLSRSAEVMRLADELGITKIREYSYSTKRWEKKQA